MERTEPIPLYSIYIIYILSSGGYADVPLALLTGATHPPGFGSADRRNFRRCRHLRPKPGSVGGFRSRSQKFFG